MPAFHIGPFLDSEPAVLSGECAVVMESSQRCAWRLPAQCVRARLQAVLLQQQQEQRPQQHHAVRVVADYQQTHVGCSQPASSAAAAVEQWSTVQQQPSCRSASHAALLLRQPARAAVCTCSQMQRVERICPLHSKARAGRGQSSLSPDDGGARACAAAAAAAARTARCSRPSFVPAAAACRS